MARTFSVDTTPPAATIDSHPSDPSDSASAAFSFSSNEGAATFRCALDGGVFTACASPQPYSGLGEGLHTFQVKAEDAAGNIGDPAAFSWTVDTVDPTTTIDSQPPNPSNSSTASFSFSANEIGVSFECALDHGEFSVCASPQAYTGLTDSAHSFEVPRPTRPAIPAQGLPTTGRSTRSCRSSRLSARLTAVPAPIRGRRSRARRAPRPATRPASP